MKLTFAKILKLVFVMSVVLLAFSLGKNAGEIKYITSLVQSYGYVSIFFLAVASGFNLVVPIPIISFLPLFLESGLLFTATIFVISIGMTVGDLLGFFIGNMGRELRSIKQSRVLKRLEKLKERHYWAPIIVLFAYAMFIPLPNEIIVIPLGLLGYRVKHIIWVLLVGNIVFNFISGATTIGLYSFF